MSASTRKTGIMIVGVAAVLGVAALGVAADRVVLGEFITSDICASCDLAAPHVSALVDSYPEFAFVGIHFGDSYQTPWGFDRATIFYGPMGFTTPYFVYDGVDALSVPPNWADYELEYLSRLQVSTDVTIGLAAAPTGTDMTFDFTAHICVEAGGQGKTMRIQMVDTLDNYPAASHFARYGFRQAAATEDVTLSAGQCTDVVRTVTFDATSWASPEDIRIIAWAQAPLASGPAEVYQAAILDGPFDGIFSNGFESGNLTAWSSAVP